MTRMRELLRRDPEDVAEESGDEEAERVSEEQRRALRAAANAAAVRSRQQDAGRNTGTGTKKLRPDQEERLQQAFRELPRGRGRGEVKNRTQAYKRLADGSQKLLGVKVGSTLVRETTMNLPW